MPSPPAPTLGIPHADKRACSCYESRVGYIKGELQKATTTYIFWHTASMEWEQVSRAYFHSAAS